MVILIYVGRFGQNMDIYGGRILSMTNCPKKSGGPGGPPHPVYMTREHSRRPCKRLEGIVALCTQSIDSILPQNMNKLA